MDKHNLLLLLVAALLFASMIVNSQCRLITRKQAEGYDEDDLNIGMKWEVEMMSRDEIVQVAGYGEDKLSTILITGTLAVCDKSCLAISGALVGATCHTNSKSNNNKDSSLAVKTVTDKYGEFIIDLPSHLHSISNLEKLCSITILELPKDTPCHQSESESESDFVGKYNKEIELVSIGNGIRTYTTGRMVFQPKNSQVCILKADHQEMSWTW